MAEEKAEKKKELVRRSSAKKRDLQSEKRRLRNRSHRSSVLTAIRSFETAVHNKEESQAIKTKLNTVYSLMDKGVKNGVYKANKASRTKSRLSARAAAL